MLTKSPFATPTSTPSPAMTDPNKAVKRWQLECGRNRKRVEDFASQLDVARQAFAKISTESVADERLDATAVADAITQAEKKVLALEAALKVALQRDDDAQAALKQAETEVRREDAREKVTRQQEAARVVDRALTPLGLAIRALIPSSKEVTDIGNDELTRRTVDAQREFIVWLFRACAGMPGCRTGVEPFQTDARWKAPWSDRFPTPDLVDEVIR
jgi:hypothetical protein